MNTAIRRSLVLLPILAVLGGCVAFHVDEDPADPELATMFWRDRLRRSLPRLGHRNVIVVADMAYPASAAAGTEIVWTNEDAPTVLREVLDEIGRAPHLRPAIALDAELDALTDADAPGVSAFRASLATTLDTLPARRVPHADLLAELDAAARSWKVLVLKTNSILPYSSVFLTLDCGYWSAERESALRARLASGAPR